MARLDTRLEAEGAEFLVCAHLLIEGIPAYKTYTQMPGYDIIAANPDAGTSARIQVKSRWASDSDQGFPLKNTDADFVAFVMLNRGNRSTKKMIDSRHPEIFVVPMDVVLSARNPDGWKKVMTKKIPEREAYRENWNLVRDFLENGKSNP
jgi:hypothetical protein